MKDIWQIAVILPQGEDGLLYLTDKKEGNVLELMLVNQIKESYGDREELLAGTLDHGWYGEVAARDFITGDDLASAIGLTTGISQHSDAGWLKFAYEGKVLYVAKRSLRRSISWNSINVIGAVFGSKTVNINGKTYKVRLLRARGDGLTTVISSPLFDHPATHGSEWNRLMYHVSGLPFTDVSNTLASEGITEGDWAQYSEADLGMHKNFTNGQSSWCQEAVGTYRISRGHLGVSRHGYDVPSNINSASGFNHGWRPVLELVP